MGLSKSQTRFTNLREAVRQLYSAAHWTADRPCDEVSLWAAVADAAGLEPVLSPDPERPADESHVNMMRMRDEVRGQNYVH